MAEAGATVAVRALSADDLRDVVRIDARHTGERKPAYWRRVFARFLDPEHEGVRLAVEVDGQIAGYLLGEVRAFEFGSHRCGWVFAVGIDPQHLRRGLAHLLLEGAIERFRAMKVTKVRTMVRRSDVSVLSFFRAGGFEGGPYVQLERNLEEER